MKPLSQRPGLCAQTTAEFLFLFSISAIYRGFIGQPAMETLSTYHVIPPARHDMHTTSTGSKSYSKLIDISLQLEYPLIG